MLKSPSPSRAPLVWHSLFNLNRIGDKQHLCLTHLPICTILVSPWSSRNLTLRYVYKFLINLLSPQLIPVYTVKCLLPVYEANTQFLIYLQSSFCYYSHHPNCIPVSFSSSKSKMIYSKYIPISLSILPLSIFAIIFAVSAIRLIVRWSLHFLGRFFFLRQSF